METSIGEDAIPQCFICIASLRGKKRLIRVEKWPCGFVLERWSGAGYWTTNGGGFISRKEALGYYRCGSDLVVCNRQLSSNP